MFRRKDAEENGLFATDTAQAQAPAETAAAQTPAAAAPATPAMSQTPAASVQPARPATEMRSAPVASAFRPNASVSDLTRNRLPEKAVMAPTAPAAPVAAYSGIEKANKSGKRVLTVGNDILLKGEIATCDRLVIEGKVDATLNDVHTVEISENGSFKGSANIEDAEISGLFEGDLVVRNRLVIYATGKVRGKISYGEIEIARGGELTGEIKTVSGQPGAARPAARPATAVKEAVAA